MASKVSFSLLEIVVVVNTVDCTILWNSFVFPRVSICDPAIPEIWSVICLLADEKNCLLEVARRGIIAAYHEEVVIWARDWIERGGVSALFIGIWAFWTP